MPSDHEQIHLRVDKSLLKRIDYFIEQFHKNETINLSRNAAVVLLVTRALTAHDTGGDEGAKKARAK